MKMTPTEFAEGQPQIESYAPGGFRIGGVFFEGAMILGPEGRLAWSPLTLAETVAAVEPLRALAGQVDVVLFGVGATIAPAPTALRAELEGLGLGLEPMATPSACRTYNVLLSEGRRVAAALLPV